MNSNEQVVRIGIVANEMSGDQLGAGLMAALRARLAPVTVRFEGVGGPRMLEQGCHSLVPMDRLSVMGLFEVLRHLPALLGIRRQLVGYFLAHPPDLFIGVDAPDFNLGLEIRLRQAGIKTVHYVSPTVWAWRPGRVKTLRRAADRVLSIFPFEQAFLRQHDVPVRYVGHPLAEAIPLEPDRAQARAALGLPEEGTLIGLLPGSRVSEVRALSAPFLQAADWCSRHHPGLRFLVPLVSPQVRTLFEGILRDQTPHLPIQLVDGGSREVMAAADVLLTASGTATLEGLLHKRPMVVAYRLHPLTYATVTRLKLVKVPYIAMANLLAGEALAPEFIQDAATGEALGQAVLDLLKDPARIVAIQDVYARIHRALRRNSCQQAAEAVVELLGERAGRG